MKNNKDEIYKNGFSLTLSKNKHTGDYRNISINEFSINTNKKQLFKKDAIKNKLRFISYLSKSSNDLQSIVEKKYPIIKKLLIAIRDEKGCCFSRMTGSGSVCYGLFKDQITAKKALNKLKIKFPSFWFSFAKTV